MELTKTNFSSFIRRGTLVSPDDDYYESSFKEFFNERINMKKNLYTKVSLIGLLIGILSVAAFSAAMGFITWYSGLWSFIMMFSSFTRVSGICMFSIVPTNEIDIVRTINDNEKFRKWFLIVVSFLWILWSILFIISDVPRYGKYNAKTFIQVLLLIHYFLSQFNVLLTLGNTMLLCITLVPKALYEK